MQSKYCGSLHMASAKAPLGHVVTAPFLGMVTTHAQFMSLLHLAPKDPYHSKVRLKRRTILGRGDAQRGISFFFMAA